MMMNSMDATSAIAATYDLQNQANRLQQPPVAAKPVVPPAFAPRQEGVWQGGVSPTPMVSIQPTPRPEVPVTKAIEVMISTGIYNTPPSQSRGSIFSSMASNPTAPNSTTSNEYKFLTSDEAKKDGIKYGGIFVASSSGLASELG